MRFTNRLPFEWALKLNMVEKPIKKDDDMFTVIEPTEVSGALDGIDPSSNIIINTPENHLCLKRNISGSMSLIALEDINLSGKKMLINSFIVVEFRPKIKIIAPKGVDVTFCCPSGSAFHNKIYTHVDIRHSHGRKEDVSITQIPDYLSYQDMVFTIYIDLDQMKKVNNTINIKQGQPMVDIKFQPIYHIGNHVFPNIDKVYWVKSTEIFQTFADVF